MQDQASEDNLQQGLSAAVEHVDPPLPRGGEADLWLPQLQPSVYQWSVRLFTVLRRLLALNIKLHGPAEWLQQGDIFLFNHFARFETFIPQYLIHLETGAYCRSVASHEFFRHQDRFSNYLLNLGAVSNEHPHLLAFLGAEILRGRKVVIFPEGGMVKDRRVQDEDGSYTVYSRSADRRRPHHSGAAVLALALSRFKAEALRQAAAGNAARLNAWARRLGFAGGAELLRAVRRPTRIVPANITFYPIRIDSNLLRRGAALMGRGLSPRALEELLVEGHLLLRYTDMDIRLGAPITVEEKRSRRPALPASTAPAFEAWFQPVDEPRRWWRPRDPGAWRRQVVHLRDQYMHLIYAEVTVNLSHLAARLIFRLVEDGVQQVEIRRLCRMLYLALKYCQRTPEIALHRSLLNPEAYRGLLGANCAGLDQFIEANAQIGLLQRDGGDLRFLDKLCQTQGFDQVRLDNPILVYANEVAPRPAVVEAVSRAMLDIDHLDAARINELRVDDERVEYLWDRKAFDKPRFAEINAGQTATADAGPYLLRGQPGRLGVVLCHGLLASPAELKPLAQALHAQGYSVFGVRLKGHGTSPWDLNSRSWVDWLDSLGRACEILRTLCPGICLIGFSAGATLSLRYAAEHPDLLGVATIAPAFVFRDRRMALVPLVHSANKLMRWVAAQGLSTFYPNNPEYPDINYRHIPVRALWELRRLVEDTRRRLEQLSCPLRVVQGDADPVIDPDSARQVMAAAGSADKSLQWVTADWHGIIRRDPGEVISGLVGFVHQRQQALQASMSPGPGAGGGGHV